MEETCKDCTGFELGDSTDSGHFQSAFSRHINVQATVNAKELFTSVDVSWPGSVHDIRELKLSAIHPFMKNNTVGALLLGDAGYSLTPWFLTPYKDPETNSQHRFHDVHIDERQSFNPDYFDPIDLEEAYLPVPPPRVKGCASTFHFLVNGGILELDSLSYVVAVEKPAVHAPVRMFALDIELAMKSISAKTMACNIKLATSIDSSPGTKSSATTSVTPTNVATTILNKQTTTETITIIATITNSSSMQATISTMFTTTTQFSTTASTTTPAVADTTPVSTTLYISTTTSVTSTLTTSTPSTSTTLSPLCVQPCPTTCDCNGDTLREKYHCNNCSVLSPKNPKDTETDRDERIFSRLELILERLDKLEELHTRVSSVEDRVDEIEKSQKFISQKYDELNLKVGVAGPNQLTKENESLKAEMKEIKWKLNNNEQEKLRNQIVMEGIPEKPEVIEVVIDVLKTMDDNNSELIKKEDILTATRMKSKPQENNPARMQRTSPIIIKLKNEELATNIINLKKEKAPQLTPTDVGLQNTGKLIYFNPLLTKDIRELLMHARLKLKNRDSPKYKFVWNKNGKVLARKANNTEVIWLKDKSDVDKISSQRA
ncbi:hypothetical protein B566_EDAN004703 [Ephemera danica]|nr:hypothetical protein B566_EDAN004703 [Ephemera danica]